MSRQIRRLTAALALAAIVVATVAALASSPSSAADPIDEQYAHARAQLAWCQAALGQARTAAERTWATTCTTLAQRVLDSLTATPSPTATPTPTVAPTTPPATTTAPPPSTVPPTTPAAGFPNATNTGVPAGVQLRPCGGEQTIRTAGTVIDGCLITGTVHIRANDVTIRRSKIQGGMVDTGDNLVERALIEDTEIDGRRADGTYAFGWNAAAIDYSDYTARRVNAHHTGFGFHMGDQVRIIDSYAHDWTYTSTPTPAHQDGAISNGGSDIQLIHNTLECNTREGCSAALGLFGDWEPIVDVLVQDNLFNTLEGYCVYAGSVSGKPYPDGSNIRFLNNTFGKKWNPRCGNYGPVTSWENARGNVWLGNVWIDGGTVTP